MLDLAGEENWLQHAERVVRLGATRVAEHEVQGARWVELRDPENNTFRIFGPRPR
jgi:Glyoxalase-like domain